MYNFRLTSMKKDVTDVTSKLSYLHNSRVLQKNYHTVSEATMQHRIRNQEGLSVMSNIKLPVDIHRNLS